MVMVQCNQGPKAGYNICPPACAYAECALSFKIRVLVTAAEGGDMRLFPPVAERPGSPLAVCLTSGA